MEHLRLRMNELENYINIALEKIHELEEKVEKHDDIIVEIVEEVNKVVAD